MNAESKNIRDKVWNSFVETEKQNPKRLTEIENHVMNFGDVSMKYGFYVIGDPDPNGYPVYIALHGGGHSDTPDINNQQWDHMNIYYRESVKNGIYIAPRGVRDTWDTHANPESFPLYDELIENLILFCNADPNRICITGFSAGGDGIYLITPRMADRFAGANMSAGCPNGTRLQNLRNMPILLQAGERDWSFRRNFLIAEYDAYLKELGEKYGGFKHEAYVHLDRPHNYRDNDPEFKKYKIIANNEAWLKDNDRSFIEKDTNAISFLKEQVRNPAPVRVVWNLQYRAALRSDKSFYWLRTEETRGEIIARIDRETNSVVIESANDVNSFSVLINEDLLDLDKEINIAAPEGFSTCEMIINNEDIALRSVKEKGDRNYIYTGEIKFVRNN